MPNSIHPPADKIQVKYTSQRFHEDAVMSRAVSCLKDGQFLVFDINSANYTLREYLIPSTMLPPEVAELAAMRMGMQHAATDWPLKPMEDFQLA